MRGNTLLARSLNFLFGITVDAQSRWHLFSTGAFVYRLSNMVAVLALFPLLVLQTGSLFQSSYFGPASLVEESAYTYTSANNYLTYGFLSSGLLQDFANSPHPEDHPFVYIHMPAGPDLFTAVLLAVTDHSYVLTRFIFAVIFVAGMWCYVRFAELILRNLGFTGGGFTLLFIWPWILAQGMDRLIYSPFPLLAFGPILLVAHYHETRRTVSLILAVTASFGASIYLEYSLLSGVLVSWGMLYILRLLPLERRAIALLISAAVAGIFVHLLQNFLFLGPDIFIKELTNVLSNRITGFPSQEGLKAWYQEIGVVHHGSRPVSLAVFLEQIKGNFQFFGRSVIIFTAVLALVLTISVRFVGKHAVVFYVRKRASKTITSIGKLLVWVTATILAPIVLFPAFAQEVNLRGSGANMFFLSIVVVVLVSFTANQICRHIPWPTWTALSRSKLSLLITFPEFREAIGRITGGEGAQIPQNLMAVARFVLSFLTGCVLVYGLAVIVKQRLYEYRNVYGIYHRENTIELEDLKRFPGELFMTNINTPLIGFFTNAPGFGVCNPDSVSQSGDIDLQKCKVAFMRRHEYWAAQKPKYFLFFKSARFFPGFADCMPKDAMPGQERGGKDCMEEMEHNLTKNYRLAHANKFFEVFDLADRLRSSVVSSTYLR